MPCEGEREEEAATRVVGGGGDASRRGGGSHSAVAASNLRCGGQWEKKDPRCGSGHQRHTGPRGEERGVRRGEPASWVAERRKKRSREIGHASSCVGAGKEERTHE